MSAAAAPVGPARGEAPPSELAGYAVGTAGEVAADVVARPQTSLLPVVEYQSARGRYGLLLDPVGALMFRTRKPRQWVMAQDLVHFPAAGFTLALDLCPLRGDAETTLLSYAVPGKGTVLALREQRDGGITLDLDGHEVSFGRFLDYAQWQRVAVSWDPVSGEARLYQDDGPGRVAAEAAGAPLAEPAEPVARVPTPHGVGIPAGGTLVIGQYQAAAGVLDGFDLRRGFRGSVAEVDLWADAAGPVGRPAWSAGDHGGAVGRWRFSAVGLAVQEALASGRHGAAHLGGFGADELRDARAYRVIGLLGRTAAVGRRLLPAGGEFTLQLAPGSSGGPPRIDIDKVPVRSDPIDPGELPWSDEPRFRTGPLHSVQRVRLHRENRPHRDFYAQDRSDGLLPDRLGRGPALHIVPCDAGG